MNPGKDMEDEGSVHKVLGLRTVETEEQAKELLAEVQESNELEAAKSNDQRELEKVKAVQDQLGKLNKAWDKSSRRQRRAYSQKFYGDKYRYSARLKRRLKGL